MCSGITNGSTESYCISQGEFRPSSLDSETRLSFVLAEAVYASRSRVYAFTMSVRYRSERDYASSANVNHRNSKLILYDIDTRIPDTRTCINAN